MARRIKVALIGQNDTLRRTIEELLGGHQALLLKPSGATGNADIAIFELDESHPTKTLSAIRSLLGKDPQVEVFVTTGRTDSQIMLEVFRIGVKEYLPQPITRLEFDAALARFQERQKGRHGDSPEKAGKVISLIGAKGGVGTSTVAANLAICLKHAHKRKSVALVDLNPQTGDLPLFLDLPSRQGLNDLSQDVTRLDETILESMMATHSSGIHLLQSGCDGSSEHKLAPGCALHTLELTRALYDHVFVDCGYGFDDVVKEALEVSRMVILITTLSLPAIRRAKHLLGLMRESNIGREQIVLAVNRHKHSERDLLVHAEEVLERKALWLIPNDYVTANSALSHGEPLMIHAPKTGITRWYLEQAAALGQDSGEAQQTLQPATGKMSSLLSRSWRGFGFAPKAR